MWVYRTSGVFHPRKFIKSTRLLGLGLIFT